MPGLLIAVCVSSCGDESSRHDPALIPGTWLVPAGVGGQQASVKSITYSANQTYVTDPLAGVGSWQVHDGNVLNMACTPLPAAQHTVYCKSLTLNFEVSRTELVWQWSSNVEWKFNRAP